MLWPSDVVKSQFILAHTKKTEQQNQDRIDIPQIKAQSIDKRSTDISNKFVPICRANDVRNWNIYQNQINIAFFSLSRKLNENWW